MNPRDLATVLVNTINEDNINDLEAFQNNFLAYISESDLKRINHATWEKAWDHYYDLVKTA